MNGWAALRRLPPNRLLTPRHVGIRDKQQLIVRRRRRRAVNPATAEPYCIAGRNLVDAAPKTLERKRTIERAGRAAHLALALENQYDLATECDMAVLSHLIGSLQNRSEAARIPPSWIHPRRVLPYLAVGKRPH